MSPRALSSYVSNPTVSTVYASALWLGASAMLPTERYVRPAARAFSSRMTCSAAEPSRGLRQCVCGQEQRGDTRERVGGSAAGATVGGG